MNSLFLAGLISLILNALGCLINYLYYQTYGWLLLRHDILGGEITVQMGYGGLRLAHVFAMTPDTPDRVKLEFSVFLFVICFVITLIAVYVILLIIRKAKGV